MKTGAEKSNRDSQSRALVKQGPKKNSGSNAAFHFIDNRPEARQLRKLQEMADNGPQAQEAAQRRAMFDNNPRMVAQRQQVERVSGKPVQRQEALEEEDLQIQAEAAPVQGKALADAELMQGNFAATEAPAQLQSSPEPQQNKTGLPDNLKVGIENLSAVSLDNVKVHYNSAKPAQLNALAYTQGTDIHVGPGQEQHLPHEAWHVVQQSQGRVRPTISIKGTHVNDDLGLENDADVMGARALDLATNPSHGSSQNRKFIQREEMSNPTLDVIQRAIAVAGGSFDTKIYNAHSTDAWPNRERGAKIIIEFTPGDSFGQDGERVSLVQSVKDTMVLSRSVYGTGGVKKTVEENPSDLNKTAGFDKRMTDAGWAIDQQIYNETGDLVNLDPRYAEQRMDEGEDYKQRPQGDLSRLKSDGGDLVQGMVVSAVNSGGTWTTALLSDEPTIPHPNLKTLTGKQEFEVVAMYEPKGGDLQYIGSVRWGWECDGQGNVTLLDFEIGSDDWASDAFVEAAVAWNAMVL